MKAIQKIKFLVLITLVALIAANCKKDNSITTKSAKLAVNFSIMKNSLKSTSADSIGFEVNSLKISIANFVIEENSGNDREHEGEEIEGPNDSNDNNVEQEGEHEGGEGDNEDEKDEGSETEQDDILLAGPYVLEIIDSNATIGEVDVYPGTFKKVDFTFLVNDGPEFNGNSIMLKGNYTTADGTIIPVTVKSAFDQQVQLQLADGGVTIASNNLVTLSVVLDAQTWMESIDLSTAILKGGEILIDNVNNQKLLAQFNAVLTLYIEVED